MLAGKTPAGKAKLRYDMAVSLQGECAASARCVVEVAADASVYLPCMSTCKRVGCARSNCGKQSKTIQVIGSE